MYSKNQQQQLHSTVMKRTTEWIFSQEIPSDITVRVRGTSFSLHKFPLVSKCGYIKKLLTKLGSPGSTIIEVPDIPGGPEAFELAAKFCYGINFEISIENIAMLRCAAEYLQMTEDYAIGNLVNRTETYLKEVALKSLSGSIMILHQSEKLLPMAEKVKLVSKCIDSIAFLACKESGFNKIHENVSSSLGLQTKSKPMLDWWAKDLSVLTIEIFQRVIMAMIARGFKQSALGSILMLYAENALRELEIFGRNKKKMEQKHEHEKRIMLESIVSLLPREKNAMPVSFLCMLLKAAIHYETMVSCRLDLEKRIALQLEQAVLSDILIPLNSLTIDTLYDVDTVKRIIKNYKEYNSEGNPFGYDMTNNSISPSPSEINRVGILLESYISEIASDHNLTASNFISLAELISQLSKTTEGDIYRPIDIYLKAHPKLSDMEKRKICSLMSCSKKSIEGSAHETQSNWLPVQTVVQVLYHDKQKLQDSLNDNLMTVESPTLPKKVKVYSMDFQPSRTELLSLQRENEELKVELLSMRMRIKELEKSSLSKSPTLKSMGKSQLPKKSIINTLSKKFGWFSPFMRLDGAKTSDVKGHMMGKRDRRHSIS